MKDSKIGIALIERINKEVRKELSIMEVCGTHTRSIAKYGIDKILHDKIRLLSGPGCPICVTDEKYIGHAIELSQIENVIIVTFGDMMRVPDIESRSLEEEKAKGAQVVIIYSPLQCIEIAKKNPYKEIVFLAVGFETTAPIIALMLKKAKEANIKNISILNSIKTMPKAMEYLMVDREIKVDAFICPGHVATIIGTNPFEILGKKYNKSMVICGFQDLDILAGILEIVNMVNNKEWGCKNFYKAVVKKEGNPLAKDLIDEVFKKTNGIWRGIGVIEDTGYDLSEEYEYFNSYNRFKLDSSYKPTKGNCICGEILKGKKTPKQCSFFGKQCTPSNPKGPCMVTLEGTCGIYYEREEA